MRVHALTFPEGVSSRTSQSAAYHADPVRRITNRRKQTDAEPDTTTTSATASTTAAAAAACRGHTGCSRRWPEAADPADAAGCSA